MLTPVPNQQSRTSAAATIRHVTPQDPPEGSAYRDDASHALPYRIIGSLTTDDPHWRRRGVISALSAAAAAAGAWRTDGATRPMLGGGALLPALPAVSLASMIAIALLAKRLDRGGADRG